MKDHNPEHLIQVFHEAGFSIAEPIFSESQGRRYLVVFQSAKLFIKFSNDGTDLFVWIAFRQSGGNSEWHSVRPISRMLVDDHRIDYDPFPLLGSVEGIAHFLIREHDSIVSLFSSCTTFELASRARNIEERERVEALRSLGIDYKPRN